MYKNWVARQYVSMLTMLDFTCDCVSSGWWDSALKYGSCISVQQRYLHNEFTFFGWYPTNSSRWNGVPHRTTSFGYNTRSHLQAKPGAMWSIQGENTGFYK